MKNFAVGLMAGKFVKFGSIALIASCALIVRVAKAAAGHESKNEDDFRVGSLGDKPLFIEEINK